MDTPTLTEPVMDTPHAKPAAALADLAGAVAQQSMQAVRERSRQLRDQTQHVSDRTVDYIRREPVQAVLIAAAAGAAVAALLGMLARSNGRH